MRLIVNEYGTGSRLGKRGTEKGEGEGENTTHCTRSILEGYPLSVSDGFVQKVNKRVGVAVSEPEADRGPRAGSPLGVVDATGQRFNLRIVA